MHYLHRSLQSCCDVHYTHWNYMRMPAMLNTLYMCTDTHS